MSTYVIYRNTHKETRGQFMSPIDHFPYLKGDQRSPYVIYMIGTRPW